MISALRARVWRPGRDFGRRLTRVPPPPPGLTPLYSLGTRARIERLAQRCRDGWLGPEHLTDEALALALRRPLPEAGLIPRPRPNPDDDRSRLRRRPVPAGVPAGGGVKHAAVMDNSFH